MQPVQFYYDYISPYSYLAYTQLHRLAEVGEVQHRPVLLGAILATLGLTPPVSLPGHTRVAYLKADLKRWAARYGVQFKMHPRFPFSTLIALRGASFAEQHGALEAYSRACFEAVWVDGRDLDRLEVACEVAASLSLDPEAYAAHVDREDVKATLKRATTEAVQRGAFGLPTFFVGDTQLFGNDRLDFVVDALKAER